MKKITAVVVAVGLACLLSSSGWAQTAAAKPDLASADWSVNSPHSLATNPPSDEAEVALLNKLDSIDMYFRICSSRFVDLRHSGNLSLVVSASDETFCHLSIIDKTASGFELYNAEQARYSEGPEIEDLAGNGNLELIVETDFTGWRGKGTGPCLGTWPVIYAWTGSGYTDVSSQYKGYYEQKLASLKEQIAAHSEEAQAPAASQTPQSAATRRIPVLTARMSTTESSSSFSPDVLVAPANNPPEASPSPAEAPAVKPDLWGGDCTEAEAAKIERFLGIDKDAGMADAIKWADSDNPYQREFAASVLGDIGTPDAVEYLRTLSRDPHRVVAGDAGVYLRFAGRPLQHTIEREQVKRPVAESPALKH